MNNLWVTVGCGTDTFKDMDEEGRARMVFCLAT